MFTNDVIDAYIGLKMQEVTRFRMSTASGQTRAVLQLLTQTIEPVSGHELGGVVKLRGHPAFCQADCRLGPCFGGQGLQSRCTRLRWGYGPLTGPRNFLPAPPAFRGAACAVYAASFVHAAAAAGVYVWYDKDGRPQYSDRPQAGARRKSR
ncbi:MAG: DUF4124 domain-containing protein [Steroidobacteraceae bacterium]